MKKRRREKEKRRGKWENGKMERRLGGVFFCGSGLSDPMTWIT
jgi:hypothetical protein